MSDINTELPDDIGALLGSNLPEDEDETEADGPSHLAKIQRNVPIRGTYMGNQIPMFKMEYVIQAERACLAMGATDAQLANYFQVSTRILAKWRRQFPEFDEAIRRGKAFADGEVAESLFRLATGRQMVIRKKVFFDFKTGQEKIVAYDEVLPPESKAAMFWLRSRQPDQWRDLSPVKEGEKLEHMTDEELLALAEGRPLPEKPADE